MAKKIDYGKVRTLYLAGWTDQEIAEDLKVSTAAIYNWRRENNLPSQAERKKQAEVPLEEKRRRQDEARQVEQTKIPQLAKGKKIIIDEMAGYHGDDGGKELVVPIYDPVSRPAHYADKQIEVVDYIEDTVTPEGFEGYCVGNVIKYISRYRKKNGVEDLKKARTYLDWVIERLEARND
ncbi:DUF3310 domain-containing protein [Christensenellaceae bacterium OttesenSCG-928-K19]|nr:DUF3310 domain-containing protein [Christensenellaceae bacterium OttesenSCG-928-K19]